MLSKAIKNHEGVVCSLWCQGLQFDTQTASYRYRSQRTEKRAVQPLLPASLEVRDHVPQFVERLQLFFNFTEHMVLGRGEAKNLVGEIKNRTIKDLCRRADEEWLLKNVFLQNVSPAYCSGRSGGHPITKIRLY